MEKEIKITVGVVIPTQPHDLLIQAVCGYFQIDRDELFSKRTIREITSRKGILYHLMRTELSLTSYDVSVICGTSRQCVDNLYEKTDWSMRSKYLQIVCDYNNIKNIYSNLLKEQEEWLQRVSP